MMVNKYNSASGTLLLQSDLAARKPIYIYFSEKKNKLLYSESLVALLDSNEVQKPLAVSHEGVSFLLQSGVVPPPKTVYENIYIVGIGDEAEISNFNGSISLKFRHNFPFLQSKRETGVSYEVSFDQILNKLFDATVKEIDKSKETFVFHSAGKDSNPIVLSIAEAGLQDQFTLVTHKSEKKGDESEISKSIADRLGFRHEVLSEVEIFEQKHLMCIDKHYRNSPLPCTDNVSIAYPLYVAQQPSLQDCNIIDGMGSDVYIGHVPSAIEYKRQKLSNVFSFFRSISSYVSSTSNLLPLTRTRAEWTGLSGFSYKDSKTIYGDSTDISNYWKSVTSHEDYLDFRASVRGRVIDTEIFMRKVRNFSDAFGNNLNFPWADENVVKYFMYMPEKYLVDRHKLRNKVLLREMLKQKIDLDSDKIGKMGYNYDSKTMVLGNIDYIFNEIKCCELWNLSKNDHFLDSLIASVKCDNRVSNLSAGLIYRLFMLSLWHNKCRWLSV